MIIIHKAIKLNNFFPYLSIKDEVYGVSNIDENPKIDITIPISDLEYPVLSKNKGNKKKQEKFTKKKQLEKVAKKKFLLKLKKFILLEF